MRRAARRGAAWRICNPLSDTMVDAIICSPRLELSFACLETALTQWLAGLRIVARRAVVAFVITCFASHAAAMAPQIIHDLAFGDGDVRDAAIAAVVESGDPRALAVLEAWRDGAARRDPATARVLLVDGERWVDAATGAAITDAPDAEEIIVNNRLRRELDGAISALRLASPDRSVR